MMDDSFGIFWGSTSFTVALGNVGHQGLEERMLEVLLGSEDISVALCLLAHLSGNAFCERLEGTLLVEVPVVILVLKDLDKVVETSVL